MSLANRKVDEMPTFRKGFLILLVLYHIPTCIATLRQQPQQRQDLLLIPWGGYQPYDLAYVQPETNGLFSKTPPELIRVQVKLAHMSADGTYIEFHTSTKDCNRKRVGYRGKIEMFAAYCAELGKVYVVNVNDAPVMKMTLRLKKVQVGEERKYIKWAKDYEL